MVEEQVNTSLNLLDSDVANAVADAVMVAYIQCIKTQAENPEVTLATKNMTVEETLRVTTSEACKNNSLRAITFLQNKYAKLFEHLFLLQGSHTANEPFKELPTGQRHRKHYYAFAKSYDGQYLAISPANYRLEITDDQYQPMTDILSSNSLADVLQTIRRRDGGSWPTDEQVLTSFEDYSPPSITNRDEARNVQIHLVGNMPEPGYQQSTFWFGTIRETIPWSSNPESLGTIMKK